MAACAATIYPMTPRSPERGSFGVPVPASISSRASINYQPLTIHPIESPSWDGSIAAFPNASVFHTSAWARVLTDTYAFTPLYLVWSINNQPLTINPSAPPSSINHQPLTINHLEPLNYLWPLMEARGSFARRGISLPFTDVCAPLLSDSSHAPALWNHAVALARTHNWRSIELRGGTELIPGATPSTTFYRHTLDLTPGPDQLLARCDSAIRRGIRKAESAGLQVRISQSEDAVRAYYRLHCLTRKRHGLPPQPYKFFANIHRHLIACDMGMIVTALHQGQPIAAAIYLRFGNKAVYKFGASDDRFQHLRPNNLVMWAGIKSLAQNGCTQLCFGRTSLGQDGLRRFKQSWGSTETQIHYAKYNLRHNRFETQTDRAHGWHNRIFRALPLWMSRLAGQILYRYMA